MQLVKVKGHGNIIVRRFKDHFGKCKFEVHLYTVGYFSGGKIFVDARICSDSW